MSLAAGVWALSAGTAQAQGGHGVYWSIGVNQPGVSVGVSNAPPVVYQQRPQVVVVERPVVYERPLVYQRPLVVQQQPVVVYQTRPYVVAQPVVAQPVVVYRERGYRRDDDRRGYKRDKWHKRHDRHRDRWDD